jgi:hypothetical protein
MSESWEGGCLCGAVRYEGHGAIKGVEVCHCRDCQRWVGGPFLSIRFSDGVTLTDESAVRWFESSEWAERGSCATCGSAMFWRQHGQDTQFAVAAGQLDDQAALPPIAEHIFTDSRPAYYDFSDHAPRLTRAEVLARFQQDLEAAKSSDDAETETP